VKPLPLGESQIGERLRQLVNGYQVTQAIYVAVTLGLPDLLAEGPRTAADLAVDSKADARSLYRLLRALGALGVLAEDRHGDRRSFTLTEMGQLLRSDVPGSLAGWAGFVARPYHWDAWGDLLHTVRTGQEAFAARHEGESVWTWRERHPEESRIFDRAMSAIAAAVAGRLADGYDFTRFGSLVDLGGGDGTLLATVLPHHPPLRGVLLDLPHVVAGAHHVLAAAGVADRCDIVAGSFFEQVPSGGEAYILKSILHDWDDTASTRILQRVHEASEPGAALLIVERVLADVDPSPVAAMSDLNMMVNTGGAERTTTEWMVLIQAGGFELTRSVDIGLGWSVLEATRR
jgi:O-methyltransferase domain/Dimerisation domain